jgi:hypothetical protein
MPIQTQPKYDGTEKKKVIQEHTKIKTFGKTSINTAIVTFDICLEKTKIFRSWDNIDKLINPSKIGNSTSASPYLLSMRANLFYHQIVFLRIDGIVFGKKIDDTTDFYRQKLEDVAILVCKK